MAPATVMSKSDGSASLYLSSGGGYKGGRGIETVQTAAQRAVAQARLIELPKFTTSDFLLAAVHGVNFYLFYLPRMRGLRSAHECDRVGCKR